MVEVPALKVRLVLLVKFQKTACPVAVTILEPNVSERVLLLLLINLSNVILKLFESNNPLVKVMVPVVKRASWSRHDPPEPSNVTLPIVLPLVVIVVVPEVPVKERAEPKLLPLAYVIPDDNLNVAPLPAIVRVTDALWVSVFVYPVISRELIVMDADNVELLAPVPTPLKNTSSADVGTEASFVPPDVADQLVGAVAFQLTDDPPPTQ